MKTFLKWLLRILGAIVLLILIAFGWIYYSSSSKINETFEIDVADISLPPPDSATVARGLHIARTHGCMDCHGENLDGRLFMDGMPVARISSSNITPVGRVSDYSTEDWVRAIRHGVGPSGKTFWIMPSKAYSGLSEEDLAALITYLKSIEPLEGGEFIREVGPVGRVLVATGALKLSAYKADHDRPFPVAPEPGPTAAYGEYLIDECRYCHGDNLTGGLREGDPEAPLSSNLTPGPEGIGHYDRASFAQALRTGVKPDGAVMNPAYMPWTATTHFTDEEIDAMWAYLQTLEPAPTGP